MDTWGEYFDLNAMTAKVEALEARIALLEERCDKMLEYIGEMNFIQATPMGGLIPRNRVN